MRGLAAAAVWLGLATPAGAQRAGPPVFVLLLPGEGDEAQEALRGAFEVELSDVGVRLVVERAIGFPSLLSGQVEAACEIGRRLGGAGVFWADLPGSGGGLLYFVQPEDCRLLARTVEAVGDAERVEALAAIVRHLARAVLAGDFAEPAPPPPPPVPEVDTPVPGPPTPPEAARPTLVAEASERSWLGIDAAYVVDWFSDDEGPAHGLRTGVLFHPLPGWSLFAEYRFLAPVGASAEGVGVTVTGHPIELGVLWQWGFGDWAVGGALSGIADYVTRTAVSSTELIARPDEGLWLFGVGAQVHGSWAFRAPFRLFLEAGVDVPIGGLEYVLDTGSGRQTLLATMPVRPRLVLGTSIDIL